MAIIAKQVQKYKTKAVEELKTAFSADEKAATLGPDFIFADYRGLTVEQITALRKQLRGKEASFKVVKNNFAQLAFEELNAPDVSNFLIGPTAIAIASRDSNEIAKMLLDFSKEAPTLKVKGGLVGNKVYTGKEVETFSKLPGKLELIAMLMSVMNAPARNITAALNDIPARLVRTVKAVADKKGASAA